MHNFIRDISIFARASQKFSELTQFVRIEMISFFKEMKSKKIENGQRGMQMAW